jgi:hypothetical protein
MVAENLVQLGLGGASLGLLGYALKLIIPRLLKKIDEKDRDIEALTAKFTETINHKQTEFTKAITAMAEAQRQLAEAHDRHTISVDAQTEIFKHLIECNSH